MPHTTIEYYLIKKYATHVFPRDEVTTQAFVDQAINATFCGNIMLDNLQPSPNSLHLPSSHHYIGIVPGSRETSYQNITLILKQLELWNQNPGVPTHYILAKAPQLKQAHITQILTELGWRPNESHSEFYQNKTTLYITTHFPDALMASDLIIGLAGTANEQAIYYGHKVICFEGHGPQSTLLRFQEQQKLLGQDLILCNPITPQHLYETVKTHLKKQAVTPIKKCQHAKDTIHTIKEALNHLSQKTKKMV